MLIVGDMLGQLVAWNVFDEAGPPAPGFSELDVHLGPTIWTEKWEPAHARVHRLAPGHHEAMFNRLDLVPGVGYGIKPGEFILARTRETFTVPADVYGVFTLRSWAARSGLEQSASLVLKPGWSGTLVLELRNNLRLHELLVEPGDPVGQIQFFLIAPNDRHC